MGELLAALLEMITPKRKVGKTIWGVLFALMIVIVVVELLGDLGL